MEHTARGTTSATIALIATIIGLSAFIVFNPSQADAQVQYVKICSLYGAGFEYLPGTDICVDFETNEARQLTAGGTWRWRMPESPWTWVQGNPETACRGGKLVKFGDIAPSDLTLNAHSRYETSTDHPLKLKKGQYVAAVLYHGGFTSPEYQVADLPSCPSSNTSVLDATDVSCTAGDAPVGGGAGACEVACVNGGWEFTGNHGGNVGNGNFCMYYYYVDPNQGPAYSLPLGCVDTGSLANAPGTLTFTATNPLPPTTSAPVSIVGANGHEWTVPSAADIQGSLSVWLCLRK
ncbi:MAG TPA: porin [Candidatus Binataceae bacterium]|nr:porin [Candidatus Binataceae bacterium]